MLQSMGSQRVGHDWATELNFLLWSSWCWVKFFSTHTHTTLGGIFWRFNWSHFSLLFFICSTSVIPSSMLLFWMIQSVHFSRSVVSDSLWPHGLQHTRLPCPSPILRTCSNSCLSSWWCHPTVSSSAVPFSSCLQSFPASESFLMSQFFPSGGQSIEVSASVLPMNGQDWFPLGWTCLISLQSKWLSRVFSNTPVQKHQFFSA